MIRFVDVNSLFEKYYKNDKALLDTVLTHSEMVARKALLCIRNRNLNLDKEFIYIAALLHDIGVVRCKAPGILCNGSLPYLQHGLEGGKILRKARLPHHALVCERHTGAGLSKENIINQNLPLPKRDFLPVSDEEKIICYADKFFSKSGNLSKEKSLDEVVAQMEKFGKDSLQRFLEMHEMFGN